MISINLKKNIYTSSGTTMLNINTKIFDEKVIGIFGNSGVGKTTFLRMLAGLTKPDSGTLYIDGKLWYDSQTKINLKPHKRDAGFVFQQSTVFPNKTVLENILYANPDKKTANELLELMRLENFRDLLPVKLSGGQKQRVAIARALARKPKILLMDEPFSSLDKTNKICMYKHISLIKENTISKIFFVSHDLAEVQQLSDRIIRISDNGNVYDIKKPDINLTTQNTLKIEYNKPINIHLSMDTINLN